MGWKQALVFLLFCLSVFTVRSQTSAAGYALQWQTVDSLITKKGLTASALAIVNRLYVTARKEKNQPQVIKALVYRLHLEEKTSDEGPAANIKELESAADSSSQPARSVLQNILAGLYQRYLLVNYSKFAGRTNVSHAADRDFTTWSGDDVRRRIATLYLGSLKEERLLAATSLASYSAVVISGNVSQLRPTLFDLLAHTALNYFKTAAPGTVDPINAFEMDDSLVFADAADFAGHRFATPDTLAPHYQALVLFQRLVRLHMADNRPDALVDLEIERLVFANSVAVTDDKEALYVQALGRLTARYGELPAAAQAWYLLARLHVEDATEGSRDTTGYLQAKGICEKVLTQKDSSQGKANCSILLNTLLKQQVFLQMERINIPQQPIAALVSWQNCYRLQLRIYRLDDAMEDYQIRVSDGAFWNGLFAHPVYRAFSQSLPETGDLRMHRAEMAIGSLPPGYYALVVSTDSSWSDQHGSRSIGIFSVSNIAYINQGADYFVVNRETGHPLAGAVVQVWNRTYTRNGNDLKKAASYTTDNEGHFVLAAQPNTGVSQLLEISTPGDRLGPIDGNVYTRFYSPDTILAIADERTYEEAQAHTYLFTDRSIYRPGQTVYFKGITVTKDGETHRAKILAGLGTTVTLFNANDQVMDTLRQTTNAFGSFHGSFTLPTSELNGVFRIFDQSGNGTVTFRVEEYKRPRFFVEYDKQQGNYRVGDSIHISGLAKGYAGNGVDGATAHYRVFRQTRFPYHWMFWRRDLPGSVAQEIAHGELKTDAAGKFSFVFFATPDHTVHIDQDPEFDYSISTDVTDISGETRSAATSVVAAYTSVRLAISLPQGDHLAADSFRRVQVSATNLSGQPITAGVHVSIYPLLAPQRLVRQRLWEAPDRYIYSEKEWLDSFPHNEYRRETEKESWEKGGRVWDASQSLTGTGEFAGGSMAPGWYAIEATTRDESGREIKDLHYVELYDGKTGKPGNPQYSWDLGKDMIAEPGENAYTVSGSSASDVYVIRSIERPAGTGRGASVTNGQYSHFVLNGEQKRSSWSVTEKDRGGFGVLDLYIKDNRRYSQWSLVRVPWTNKTLDIHYSSFRDKTEPGSVEKWQLTISGYQQERVPAEVLTAMYDVSLDKFATHAWDSPFPYPVLYGKQDWVDWSNFRTVNTTGIDYERPATLHYRKAYDELLNPETVLSKRIMVGAGTGNMMVWRGNQFEPVGESRVMAMGVTRMAADGVDYSVGLAGGDMMKKDIVAPGSAPQTAAAQATMELAAVNPRKDFRETAFFFPDLLTDSAGSVSFSFTMPDAVTSWKWLTLAGTRDAAFGYSERTVVTQKELMVEPNAPRFLREGDKIELPVKVINMTDSELTGQMSLQLTDPTTGQTADGWFVNRQPNQYFTVEAHQSAVVAFPLDIPYQYNRPLTYKVVAEARGYSDGEEATLPVMSNRLLVTESLPLNMPGDGTRHFTFAKLLASGSSETLNNHALTVEFTANPAWYAVQSLPYMLEQSDECSEQVFSRLYANALASKIANSSPRLQQVFARWRDEDTTQLLSNLEKNQELKTVLLAETPWVLEGKSESQQKKAVAMLFDMGRMSKGLEAAVDKLSGMQLPDGSFPWFAGGPGDRYITQYVVTGIGHLLRLQAVPATSADKMNAIVKGALPWLDGLMVKDYTEAKAAEERAAKKAGGAGGRPGVGVAGVGGARADWIGPFAIQYLYMRSLFGDFGIPGNIFPAMNYYRKKLRAGWLQQNRYMQGMIALALYRTGDVQTAKDIIASLKQNAIRDEEKGMYWKGMEGGGYYWYNAPVETQSLLIEAFREIGRDAAIDRALKTWLLKQKQTHNWATTTATADACYALLLGGQDWLNAERDVVVKLGDKTVDFPAAGDDAGVGYNKKVFDGPFVNPSMGNITVTMLTKGGVAGVLPGGSPAGSRGGSPAWGAVYWQYFDMLDRITPPAGKAVLSIRKHLFVKRNTDRGPVLDSLADNGTLHPGDQVVVRVELRADRDLEYVHMKDMRAACMEPVDVISGYRWQDGLGYYESTKDVSTDFFFDRLPRGTHVFEYALFVAQAGNFSNGITSIECMYAPEFSYHSEGIRVNVEAAP
jgi:Bacterial Alpha-2-macroglobulin MG10 domain/Alpha-2-macroglobulin family/MG2 domain